ncbi:AfsR/SARP family transcriptional regulator [Kitasatospora sp. NPDC048540]|uniref:AfsR/SARP family transcriptional regulator n=1 Tax=unclassified Kitasatospora TaxID=2633591 RepID=UPI000539A58F|nr:AfsR/SARP family transcriptional regulator [Kitasatospora sp. MBT63]
MQINLLGPFVAQEQETSFAPSAAKPRQILALLALQANQVVTVPTLMEEIWGDQPPRSASTTLQTYILQLRRKLGTAFHAEQPQAAKEILVTRYGGYLLDVQPGEVDSSEFERLLALGRTALAAHDDLSASKLLGQALALWRGPALVDIQVGRVLEIEVLQLEEARLGALESRISADLRLGRHAILLSELTMLTAQRPMHEGLHAQLILAQYRSGRSWQALETYQRLRSTLVGELGIEPSARLQRLHAAVLAADTRLDLAGAELSMELQHVVG